MCKNSRGISIIADRSREDCRMAAFCRNRVVLMMIGTVGNIGLLGAGQATSSTSASIDRALLDKYCVLCHNEKLKTGGFALDKVDVNKVSANTEVLEKVVRKLRSRQMPPDGAPRPDQAV